jgi:hypothetical protein
MSDGNHRPKGSSEKKPIATKATKITKSEKATSPKQSAYNFGDEVIAETGKKSRGGLKSLAEMFTPGVEIVSGDLVSPTYREKITFSVDSIIFNSACVRLFKSPYVDLIMDEPQQRFIALSTTTITRDTAKFALVKDGVNKPRKIMARDFGALLFNYMDWTADSRYRIMAIYQKLEDKELLVFNLDEAVEVRTTTVITDDGKKKTTRQQLLPVRFRDSFGNSYSELEERKKVDLDSLFLFINPHTGEREKRKIEPRVPDDDEIVKRNYRPNPEKKKRSSNSKTGADKDE